MDVIYYLDDNGDRRFFQVMFGDVDTHIKNLIEQGYDVLGARHEPEQTGDPTPVEPFVFPE